MSFILLLLSFWNKAPIPFFVCENETCCFWNTNQALTFAGVLCKKDDVITSTKEYHMEVDFDRTLIRCIWRIIIWRSIGLVMDTN